MQEFFDEHGKKWPLMCMEFWDGWFNRWKEPIITRDPKELADAVREVLEQGSINLYMFHGGTNFGFMNGCSARGTLDCHKLHLMITMPFWMKKEIQLPNIWQSRR